MHRALYGSLGYLTVGFLGIAAYTRYYMIPTRLPTKGLYWVECSKIFVAGIAQEVVLVSWDVFVLLAFFSRKFIFVLLCELLSTPFRCSFDL